MNKTQEKEYKRFFKRTPFNFCDRFCDRCDLAGICAISRNELAFQLKCRKEGKDPNDAEVIFDEIGRSFQQIIKILRKELEKEGINPDELSDEEYEKDRVHPEKTVLYKKSLRLVKLISKFLDNLYQDLENTNPWFLASLKMEFEELNFYCYPIITKLIGALCSKSYLPDSMIDACLSFCSLINSQKNLESILNLIKDLDRKYVLQVNRILKLMKEIKAGIKRAFPGVENFKDKIIFHGRFN